MDISEKAMLVKLRISQWSNKATDRAVANEVAEKYGFINQEDVYIKVLLPRATLKDINSAVTALRTFHSYNTLPWRDDSIRILSSANFFNYRQGITERRQKLEDVVDQFVNIYPEWLDRARVLRGPMFNETNYPTALNIRKQYNVDVSFLPFPNVADFRVDVGTEELNNIKKQAELLVSGMLEASNKHMIGMIYERLYLLHSALSCPDKLFKSSTITSVFETIDLVERLNITDSDIVKHAIQISRSAMQSVDTTTMRNVYAARDAACIRLSDALKTLRQEANHADIISSE